MKYSWLYVGAKVVCVDGENWNYKGVPAFRFPSERFPQAGEILTVREVTESEGSLFLRFQELLNPACRIGAGGFAEAAFNAERFKPLHDTSKQVEAMRSLMLDATVRGKVDA